MATKSSCSVISDYFADEAGRQGDGEETVA